MSSLMLIRLYHKLFIGNKSYLRLVIIPMPRKERKAYNDYMRKYLPDYRKEERALLKKAKLQFGWVPPRQKQRSKKK